MAARAQYWTWKVTGRGKFPLDMLRYDSCYPASSADVAMIDDSMTDHRTERTIELKGYGTGPAVARWTSFMWRVTDQRSQR